MSNKRIKYTLDPVRISNYNKFLTTLDNKNKKEIRFEQIKRTMNDEEIIKKEIDKIIDTINNNFNNNISSSNFTGQTQNDISISHIENNDPNVYINYLK
jgi:hypothetical protein